MPAVVDVEKAVDNLPNCGRRHLVVHNMALRDLSSTESNSVAAALRFTLVKTIGYCDGQKPVNLLHGQKRRALVALVLNFPTELSTGLLKNC